MNSLLKLEVFKSLGFETKESGMRYVKCNVKLSNKINECVNEYEENKYIIIEKIKVLCNKYCDEMNKFINVEKIDRKYRIEEKKMQSRELLKEQMRDEIMNELKMEKHGDLIPKLNVNLSVIKSKFNDVLSEKLSEKSKKKVMEAKKKVDKAVELLRDAEEILDSI